MGNTYWFDSNYCGILLNVVPSIVKSLGCSETYFLCIYFLAFLSPRCIFEYIFIFIGFGPEGTFSNACSKWRSSDSSSCLSSVCAVHPDLHGDPVQAHHLQWLRVSRLVSGYRLLHGHVLSDLHTHLRPLQDLQVPRSHLQRGTVPATAVSTHRYRLSGISAVKYRELTLWDISHSFTYWIFTLCIFPVLNDFLCLHYLLTRSVTEQQMS